MFFPPAYVVYGYVRFSLSLSISLSVHRGHHVATANLSTWGHIRAPQRDPITGPLDLFKLVHVRDAPGPIQTC